MGHSLPEIAHGSPLEALPEFPTRLQIEAFGAHLVAREGPAGPPDPGVLHHFADQLYGRSMVLKAGNVTVGLPHKASGLTISVGDITVWTEQGRQRYTGAHVMPTVVGAMRIGYAHADTTLFTVHANLTGTEDVAAVEDALVEYPQLLQSRRAQKVLQ